jgi:2-polyprenyl-6-methoxyphenol hydroxylase-like FAD-dependent oxidoreductase
MSHDADVKDIVIVGGSIAGLAASLALRGAGHRVHIIESDSMMDCDTPLEAFERWDRRGSPQARHAHAFLARLHQLIKQHAPVLLDNLLAAGAEELAFKDRIPPTIENPEFIASDDEITMIACRRITFEWTLRRYLFSDLGVTSEEGAVVTGLIKDEQSGRIPRVCGVRYRDADGLEKTRSADLVLDASGRRTKCAEWLEGIGCAAPRKESEPCGIVYSSRFYKLRPNVELPFTSGFAGGDLGYLRYGVFPCDSGLYSLIVAASPEDRGMRALKQNEGFEAALRVLPMSREWLAPGFSEPIGDVHTMAGLYNARRFFIENGEPLALGFQPIGDALCHANPLLGRGCTYAFIQAYLLRDVLAAHSNDLREMALSFDRGVEAEIIPGYEFIRAGDRNFIRNEQVLREGRDPLEAAPESEEQKQQIFLGRLVRDGFVPAMQTDLHVLRAFTRAMNVLEPMTKMFKDPDIMARAMKAYAEKETREKPVLGPSHEEMVELLSKKVAAA